MADNFKVLNAGYFPGIGEITVILTGTEVSTINSEKEILTEWFYVVRKE